MPRKLLALVLLVLLVALAGVRPVAARQASAPLSEAARLVLPYTIRRADLPAGSRLTETEETSNEDLAASNPDNAALIQTHGRITEVSQATTRAAGSGGIILSLGLFRDAAGAWGDALDSTFPDGVTPERTLPGPDVGEQSVVFRFASGSGAGQRETMMLVFQRDRLEVALIVTATGGGASLDEVLPLARLVDSRIQAAPPPPPTPAEVAASDPPTPAVLVRGAVRLLLARFYTELDPAELLTEAWTGAARALTRAGVTDVPPPPAYPADADAAIAAHLAARQ
jgi:hypothetical protein